MRQYVVQKKGELIAFSWRIHFSLPPGKGGQHFTTRFPRVAFMENQMLFFPRQHHFCHFYKRRIKRKVSGGFLNSTFCPTKKHRFRQSCNNIFLRFIAFRRDLDLLKIKVKYFPNTRVFYFHGAQTHCVYAKIHYRLFGYRSLWNKIKAA